MARPYAGEMGKLASTFDWAAATDLGPLRQAVRVAGLSPLRVIGSGGSLTGAHALAGLHQRYTGHLAAVATPLDALNEALGPAVATWLLSAGGGNTDILAAAKALILREPRQIGILCGREASPLADLCRRYPFVDLLLYPTPTGKDGFLATNSLLGFTALLTRAYAAEFGSDADWGEVVDHLKPLLRDTADALEEWEAATESLWTRSTTLVLHGPSSEGVTDVIVDISALSAGISFPIVRYFFERIDRGNEAVNLHVFVVHDPHLDSDIRSIASDAPGYVHGFKGRSTLSEMADAAKLWLPQLATGRRAALERLYGFIEPHDTCPILPFPASNPRLGDELAEEYLTELESTWSVDTRNIIYADEEDPLDLYRTILRLDDLRKQVFAETGGSMLVLSPLGSKLMAVGALMAALERNLPVVYLESVGYEFEAIVPEEIGRPNLIHLWLEGDVYPRPRPALPK